MACGGCGHHRGLPPFWRQAGSAAAAVGRAATSLVTGESPVAQRYLVQVRLATCASCPHYLDGRCNDLLAADGTVLEKGCGCFVAVKAELNTESCPLGHW
jgi:hypothetical protein